MNLHDLRAFSSQRINDKQLQIISDLAVNVRKDIVTMITTAGSGHPGGALSSADIYLMLWLCARCTPSMVLDRSRDRIVVSHGHTAAALYAVLGNLGYINRTQVLQSFRKPCSPYEGHPNCHLPGIEWCSGSLGQGLSIGAGFALASRLTKHDYHTFVVMGDGEQQKGQITEAREFAAHYHLHNLTAIIDMNGLQATGTVEQIQPASVRKKYESSGWKVFECNGHDYNDLYSVLKKAYVECACPTVILANTIMGKGVSFIENKHRYHGAILTKEECARALTSLSAQNNIDSNLFASNNRILPKEEPSAEHSEHKYLPQIYSSQKL